MNAETNGLAVDAANSLQDGTGIQRAVKTKQRSWATRAALRLLHFTWKILQLVSWVAWSAIRCATSWLICRTIFKD